MFGAKSNPTPEEEDFINLLMAADNDPPPIPITSTTIAPQSDKGGTLPITKSRDIVDKLDTLPEFPDDVLEYSDEDTNEFSGDDEPSLYWQDYFPSASNIPTKTLPFEDDLSQSIATSLYTLWHPLQPTSPIPLTSSSPPPAPSSAHHHPSPHILEYLYTKASDTAISDLVSHPHLAQLHRGLQRSSSIRARLQALRDDYRSIAFLVEDLSSAARSVRVIRDFAATDRDALLLERAAISRHVTVYKSHLAFLQGYKRVASALTTINTLPPYDHRAVMLPTRFGSSPSPLWKLLHPASPLQPSTLSSSPSPSQQHHGGSQPFIMFSLDQTSYRASWGNDTTQFPCSNHVGHPPGGHLTLSSPHVEGDLIPFSTIYHHADLFLCRPHHTAPQPHPQTHPQLYLQPPPSCFLTFTDWSSELVDLLRLTYFGILYCEEYPILNGSTQAAHGYADEWSNALKTIHTLFDKGLAAITDGVLNSIPNAFRSSLVYHAMKPLPTHEASQPHAPDNRSGQHDEQQEQWADDQCENEFAHQFPESYFTRYSPSLLLTLTHILHLVRQSPITTIMQHLSSLSQLVTSSSSSSSTSSTSSTSTSSSSSSSSSLSTPLSSLFPPQQPSSPGSPSSSLSDSSSEHQSSSFFAGIANLVSGSITPPSYSHILVSQQPTLLPLSPLLHPSRGGSTITLATTSTTTSTIITKKPPSHSRFVVDYTNLISTSPYFSVVWGDGPISTLLHLLSIYRPVIHQLEVFSCHDLCNNPAARPCILAGLQLPTQDEQRGATNGNGGDVGGNDIDNDEDETARLIAYHAPRLRALNIPIKFQLRAREQLRELYTTYISHRATLGAHQFREAIQHLLRDISIDSESGFFLPPSLILPQLNSLGSSCRDSTIFAGYTTPPHLPAECQRFGIDILHHLHSFVDQYGEIIATSTRHHGACPHNSGIKTDTSSGNTTDTAPLVVTRIGSKLSLPSWIFFITRFLIDICEIEVFLLRNAFTLDPAPNDLLATLTNTSVHPSCPSKWLHRYHPQSANPLGVSPSVFPATTHSSHSDTTQQPTIGPATTTSTSGHAPSQHPPPLPTHITEPAVLVSELPASLAAQCIEVLNYYSHSITSAVSNYLTSLSSMQVLDTSTISSSKPPSGSSSISPSPATHTSASSTPKDTSAMRSSPPLSTVLFISTPPGIAAMVNTLYILSCFRDQIQSTLRATGFYGFILGDTTHIDTAFSTKTFSTSSVLPLVIPYMAVMRLIQRLLPVVVLGVSAYLLRTTRLLLRGLPSPSTPTSSFKPQSRVPKEWFQLYSLCLPKPASGVSSSTTIGPSKRSYPLLTSLDGFTVQLIAKSMQLLPPSLSSSPSSSPSSPPSRHHPPCVSSLAALGRESPAILSTTTIPPPIFGFLGSLFIPDPFFEVLSSFLAISHTMGSQRMAATQEHWEPPLVRWISFYFPWALTSPQEEDGHSNDAVDDTTTLSEVDSDHYPRLILCHSKSHDHIPSQHIHDHKHSDEYHTPQDPPTITAYAWPRRLSLPSPFFLSLLDRLPWCYLPCLPSHTTAMLPAPVHKHLPRLPIVSHIAHLTSPSVISILYTMVSAISVITLLEVSLLQLHPSLSSRASNAHHSGTTGSLQHSPASSSMSSSSSPTQTFVDSLIPLISSSSPSPFLLHPSPIHHHTLTRLLRGLGLSSRMSTTHEQRPTDASIRPAAAPLIAPSHPAPTPSPSSSWLSYFSSMTPFSSSATPPQGNTITSTTGSTGMLNAQPSPPANALGVGSQHSLYRHTSGSHLLASLVTTPDLIMVIIQCGVYYVLHNVLILYLALSKSEAKEELLLGEEGSPLSVKQAIQHELRFLSTACHIHAHTPFQPISMQTPVSAPVPTEEELATPTPVLDLLSHHPSHHHTSSHSTTHTLIELRCYNILFLLVSRLQEPSLVSLVWTVLLDHVELVLSSFVHHDPHTAFARNDTDSSSSLPGMSTQQPHLSQSTDDHLPSDPIEKESSMLATNVISLIRGVRKWVDVLSATPPS